jgi:hypothetical protein
MKEAAGFLNSQSQNANPAGNINIHPAVVQRWGIVRKTGG